MWCMKLKIGMGDEHHSTNTPSFVKILEVTLQFLGDSTWNDPYITSMCSNVSVIMIICLM